MKYISTRGQSPEANFTDVLMQGLAPDGGLYVPKTWPTIQLKGQPSYIDTACAVIKPFVQDSMDIESLRRMLAYAYTPRLDGFSTPLVTPVRPLDKKLSVLELFHGPTLAFKDVALQLLGQFFNHEIQKTKQSITILGATSGDTGSAAIEGCRHAAGAQIFILYPHQRPSDVQRRQMTTVNAKNVHAIAIEGSFDDCQDIVKALFADVEFKNQKNLSAVNSINWARILAQIVYYFHVSHTYAQPVNFVVPTGNFGNVFAAYAAKKMGANIEKLVIASNRNDILTRFFETGVMQKNAVEYSFSPSMDIQVSSNFERLLFDILERDTEKLCAMLEQFKKVNVFGVEQRNVDVLSDTFVATRCSDVQTLFTIRDVYQRYGYVIDPHTAVGFHAYEMLKDRLEGPVVALACAHPAKFSEIVEQAIGIKTELPNSLANLYERTEYFTVLPNCVDTVKNFINAPLVKPQGKFQQCI
jgi:threonine synthase